MLMCVGGGAGGGVCVRGGEMVQHTHSLTHTQLYKGKMVAYYVCVHVCVGIYM